MVHVVQQIDHLETIDIKYMEYGHRYMEVDSMHATLTSGSGCTPLENGRWSSEEHRPTDFVDIKERDTKKIKNRTRITDGDIVNWLNIKWLWFQKSNSHTIQYKHRIQSEGFMKLDCRLSVVDASPRNNKT